MIETEAGAKNLEAIAAVPGVSGLLVGPADLSRAYGLPPNHRLEHETWTEALRRVVATCRERGIASVMNSSSGEDARRWIDMGFDHMVIASDIAHFRSALARELAIARGERNDAVEVIV